MSKISIFWFRNDLRLSDNPGLFEACAVGKVLPIYILDERLGAASKYWLHHSLGSLNKSLESKLNFYKGDSSQILQDLSKKHNISHLYFGEAFDKYQRDMDEKVRKEMSARNIEVNIQNSSLLWHPEDIKNGSGEFYKVFTPFYKKGCLSGPAPRDPIPVPEKMDLLKDEASLELDQLMLLPQKDWHKKFDDLWLVGEKAAQDRLYDFIENDLQGYKEGRNSPAKSHTSLLSPHLRFGEISPNQIWSVVNMQNTEIITHKGVIPHLMRDPKNNEHGSRVLRPGMTKRESGDDNKFKSWDDAFRDNDASHFLSEIVWREFSYYLLYHFEDLPTKNFQKMFDNFPWEKNDKLFDAWKRGQTGIPIVDAGMRELYQTGYMHNRVRMIVASFLVKNLLIDWREGERYFWDQLLDADIANNAASWQWVAGSGADAAPYFRIFNPILQGEKFDPEGIYTKKYVPELQGLPQKYLFKPWQADMIILHEANIRLGKDYPFPIIDLSETRERALGIYKRLKKL